MLPWEVRRVEQGSCGCEREGAVAAQVATLLDQAGDLLRPRFRRVAAHRHAVDYLRGLLADVERKNGRQLAEYAGYRHPRGIQRVLDRYAWDADLVRDDLRRWVVAELGDPNGVLVVDETSFPKQGRHSVGVARQYGGTLGKVANCQVGVFLGYASPKGQALIDRALFVPAAWFADPDRCRTAGIPASVGFRTKPQLALELLERALDAGVPGRWVVADEVYGSDGTLRRALEERGQAYVLAVRSNETVTQWPPAGLPRQVVVADLATAVPPEGWQRRSCGEGAQGPREYDWVLVPLRPALRPGWGHALLVRRHPAEPDELAYFLVYAPQETPLEELVRAAGTRWTIDDRFKLAKGQVGLDQYEVRSWHGWYRHITLALLALAALAIGAAKKGEPPVLGTFPSPSRKSVGSSSGFSGWRREHPTTSSPGPAGGAGTSKLPGNVIASAA